MSLRDDLYEESRMFEANIRRYERRIQEVLADPTLTEEERGRRIDSLEMDRRFNASMQHSLLETLGERAIEEA